MGFPKSVVDEILVKCGRRCSICGKYCGTNIELHHIVPVSKGGEDTLDNCIPLCFDCHSYVGHYNDNHPKGRKFSKEELKGHRDKCFAMYEGVDLKKAQNIDGRFIEKLFDNVEIKNIPMWGYPDQDYISPINKGNVVMVAGQDNTKKSVYVQHVVNWNIRHQQQIIYFSMRESSDDVMYSIIAENAGLNVSKLKKGHLTAEDWEIISHSLSDFKKESLKVFSALETPFNCEEVISLVEESGASIVVIDDLNGLMIDKSLSEEAFMYKLKWAAGKSNTTVFLIYNMDITGCRIDKRPILQDFPTSCYHRESDILHLLHKYSDDFLEEHWIEVIIAKGAGDTPVVLNMAAPQNINKIVPYRENDV